MGKLGAIQDLVRGVEKLTGKTKKATAAGMTEQEKDMMEMLKKSQTRTKCILVMAAFGVVIHGCALAMSCVYGLKNTAARWSHFILYALWSILMMVLHVLGVTCGSSMWIVFGILAAFSAITTFTTYSKSKKTLLLHMVIVLGLAGAVFVTSFI